jgi:hypothetical protein
MDIEKENGLAIKRPFLHNRQITPYSEVQHLNRNQALVKLVDLDTSNKDTAIYEKIIIDELKGIQKIRIINTTKPYNPDFIDSAQVLSFILPDQPSQAIITPLDGTFNTWRDFFKIHRIATETMIDLYKKRGKKDFKVLTGIGFSPYSDQDYLKTQSIKAAHLHSFLITPELVEKSIVFRTKEELSKIHDSKKTSTEEVKKDIRRFFPNYFLKVYSEAIIPIIVKKLELKSDNEFTILPINISDDGKFPLNGIFFTLDKWKTLESKEFFEVIKIVYETIDSFYKSFIMPVFTSNYEEVISDEYPNPKKLIFNSPEIAIGIFDKKIKLPTFREVDDNEKKKWRKTVRCLSSILNTQNSESFSLGPNLSVTIRYLSNNDTLSSFFVSSPFGGGAVEAMGVDKIPITSVEQDILLSQFYSPESVTIAHELELEIRNNLNK